VEYSQDRARNKAIFPSLHLVQKVLGFLKAGRTSTRTLRAPHCRAGPLGGPGEFVVHLAYFPSSSVGDVSFWSPPRGASQQGYHHQNFATFLIEFYNKTRSSHSIVSIQPATTIFSSTYPTLKQLIITYLQSTHPSTAIKIYLASTPFTLNSTVLTTS